MSQVTSRAFTETSVTYSTAVAALLSMQQNLLLHEVKQILAPHALLRPGCVGLAPCWVHQHVAHPCIVRGPCRMVHVQHSEQILATCMHIRSMHTWSIHIWLIHPVNAHPVNAHPVNAHLVNAHQFNAHQTNAHQVNAYQINAHPADAHVVNAHQFNAHQSNAHLVNAHVVMHIRRMHIRSMHIADFDNNHRHQQCHQHHHQQRICVVPRCNSSLQYLSCRHQVVHGFQCFVIDEGSKRIPFASVGAARPSLPLVGLGILLRSPEACQKDHACHPSSLMAMMTCMLVTVSQISKADECMLAMVRLQCPVTFCIFTKHRNSTPA